jgi:alpha-glucosidase/alpha-D-xyloside xylohydrolase
MLQPFDLRGEEGILTPDASGAAVNNAASLDAFFVVASDPVQIMREYAAITGFPHLPPLWSLGYMQSRRTLEGREQVLDEAKEFRRRQLPCDAFIYLGTGFTTGGWNTGHGQFRFNERIFPDPETMIRQLHDDHLRVALHVVDPPLHLSGTVHDSGDAANSSGSDSAVHYWNAHRRWRAPASTAGGPCRDKLDLAARLARIRMYWDGPIRSSGRRPFALHRNGYAGVRAMDGCVRRHRLDVGNVACRFRLVSVRADRHPVLGNRHRRLLPRRNDRRTVRALVPVRRVCPLFRAHGRTWKLRLPWGWKQVSTGLKITMDAGSCPARCDPKELHNPAVEPICKAYLELRYRLLPYLYSAVRETHETGLPVMRALWLHYPSDPQAAVRGDEYLWGRDMLVAPVVEKGATSRTLYLPHGLWYDFWTGQKMDEVSGGAEITRPVDLATTPLYVRAGAVIPTGPVVQHTGEAIGAPFTLTVYPGADGSAVVYEDDGSSFAHEAGGRKIAASWNDGARRLALSRGEGSNSAALAARPRSIAVRIAGDGTSRDVVFDGNGQSIQF